MIAGYSGVKIMSTNQQDQERDRKLLSLRLPLDLYTRVTNLADKDRRSIHSMLLVLIEDGLNQAEQPKSQAL